MTDELRLGTLGDEIFAGDAALAGDGMTVPIPLRGGITIPVPFYPGEPEILHSGITVPIP